MEGHEYLRVVGLLMWLVTDAVILVAAYRDKRYGMPFTAACLFLTYEIYTQFVCKECSSELLAPGATWILWGLLGFNFLFYLQFAVYGLRNPIVPAKPRAYLLLLITGPVMAFLLHYTFIPSFSIVNGQLLDFWMMALIVSANFVVLFFFRATDEFLGLSLWAAGLKLIANFLLALSFVIQYWNTDSLRPVYYYLFFSVFIGDLGYFGLMEYRGALEVPGDSKDDNVGTEPETSSVAP